jgi:hypothetical protein
MTLRVGSRSIHRSIAYWEQEMNIEDKPRRYEPAAFRVADLKAARQLSANSAQ